MPRIKHCAWCENPIAIGSEPFTRDGETVCKFCKEHEPCDEDDEGCGGLMTLGDLIFTGDAAKGESNYVLGTCEDCGHESRVYNF